MSDSDHSQNSEQTLQNYISEQMSDVKMDNRYEDFSNIRELNSIMEIQSTDGVPKKFMDRLVMVMLEKYAIELEYESIAGKILKHIIYKE